MNTDMLILGVSGILIVKYMVNALKLMGLPSKFALPSAIVIGIGLAIASQYSSINPQFKMWFENILTGLFMGLGAAEVYDAGKRADVNIEMNEEIKTLLTK